MKLRKIKGNSGYTTFGCMWKKGECDCDSEFICKNEKGNRVPVQSRITAYWPDGSVKWTAHTADSALLLNEFTLDVLKNPDMPEKKFADENVDYASSAASEQVKKDDGGNGITLTYTENEISLFNGIYTIRIKKSGGNLFEDIVKNGKVIAFNACPKLLLEEPVTVNGETIRTEKNYLGRIDNAEIEEQGDLQCIFKFTGTHVRKSDEKLRFVIRMRVNYNSPSIHFMHTFIYDGDENKDFLKGLGVSFGVPLSGEMYNRHIKLTGDHGVFHESAVTLQSWRPRVPMGLSESQMAGEVLCPEGDAQEAIDKIMQAVPFWGTYDICQDSVNHFEIRKKLTGDEFCYIDALHGNRTDGAMCVGSESGSVMVGIRDFWEKYPSGYTVSGFDTDKLNVDVWLWSPSARPMDFRHYAARGYNEVCYEGYDYKGADPYGIACTNEFELMFSDKMIVSDEELENFKENYKDPVFYAGEPEFYHDMRAFGYWSQPANSTETERWLEGELEKAFKFYENEVEQRLWYGMFNYGDFMHTYDISRHKWRYDVGGYAWDNTELVPTLWLWLYFMRTGRADVFRLAERLSRHTSEVDVYHIGKYKGMGSRHNVRHWGCPCKEARIAMAGHHRYYYYLTGDRRLEDIFTELKDNEQTFKSRDPLGDFYDKSEMVYISHARSGPDWSSLCSNWMTEWERKNDFKYRDKILVGSGDIKNAPLKLISGPDFEFDPDSLHLRYIGERTTGGTHLQICMGAPSIWTEMADLLCDEEWKDMMADYGKMYFLSYDEQRKAGKGLIGNREFTIPMFAVGIGAYAAKRLDDPELAKNVWKILLNSVISENDLGGFSYRILPDTANLENLKEIPWISTNFAAQFCLNAIMALDFIREYLPESLEEAKKMIDSGKSSVFRKA